MKPRISLITLGVDDLERSLRFYRDGLGLATEGIIGEQFEDGAVAFFDLQPGLKSALGAPAHGVFLIRHTVILGGPLGAVPAPEATQDERHGRGYSAPGRSNAVLRRAMRNNASNSDACCASL